MKAGTMKFLLNAAIDTIPTAANLQRWKKSPSDKCKLCLGRQTTDHCLNICKVGLDTGRWTWRHNNVLKYIMDSLDTTKFSVFSDLPGLEAAGGGTIPPEICVTNLKPDIVILDKKKRNCTYLNSLAPWKEILRRDIYSSRTSMPILPQTSQISKLQLQHLKSAAEVSFARETKNISNLCTSCAHLELS